MVIGLNLKMLVIELFLFTMLNMKKLLNQLIDSLPMILIPNLLMSINKLLKIGTPLKVIGIISTSDILTMIKPLLVT